MALNIKHYPQDYRTVYNPVEVVLFESTTAVRESTGFSYLIDVKDGATLLGRLKVPPTTEGYGRFDLAGIMESYLTSDFGQINGTNIESVFFNNNSYKDFTLEFGWLHYGSGSVYIEMPKTVILPDGDTATSQTLLTINASLPNYRRELVNFYDWQYNNYFQNYIPGTVNRRWLTNQPKGSQNSSYNLSLQYTDEGYLYFLMDSPTNFDKIILQTYTSTGADLDLTELSVPNLSTGKHIRIPSAPATLNAVNSSRVAVGSQPIVGTTAAFYSIQLKYGTDDFMSQKMFFNIDTECRYETRRLEFLNSLGGFDCFNFTKVSKHSEEIDRKFFKANPSDLNTSTGAIDYSITNREKVQYYTSSKSKMKLNSDWINAETFNWLLELIESPEVYMLDTYTAPSGSTEIRRLPIKNIEGNWEEKVSNTDKIFNLVVDLEFSMDNNRQRF